MFSIFGKNRIQRMTLSLVAVSALSIIAGYAAVAATNQMVVPTVVVTFNIEEVSSDLTERADAETKLRNLIMGIDEEIKSKLDAVAKLEEELEATADADRPIINEELDRLKLEALSYQNFAVNRMDIERSILLRDLYKKIKTAVADIAEQNGYDLVLINDAAIEMNTNPQEKVSRVFQVQEQLAMKRIVYASNQIDITEQIVSHMNLEWEKTPSN